MLIERESIISGHSDSEDERFPGYYTNGYYTDFGLLNHYKLLCYAIVRTFPWFGK